MEMAPSDVELWSSHQVCSFAARLPREAGNGWVLSGFGCVGGESGRPGRIKYGAVQRCFVGVFLGTATATLEDVDKMTL
jgi:hypothetical protein